MSSFLAAVGGLLVVGYGLFVAGAVTAVVAPSVFSNRDRYLGDYSGTVEWRGGEKPTSMDVEELKLVAGAGPAEVIALTNPRLQFRAVLRHLELQRATTELDVNGCHVTFATSSGEAAFEGEHLVLNVHGTSVRSCPSGHDSLELAGTYTLKKKP